MEKRRTITVVPRDGKWAVIRASASSHFSVHEKQGEAVSFARKLATNEGAELVVHGKDGRICERSAQGDDGSSFGTPTPENSRLEIVPTDEGWLLRREGDGQAIAVYGFPRAAWIAAERLVHEAKAKSGSIFHRPGYGTLPSPSLVKGEFLPRLTDLLVAPRLGLIALTTRAVLRVFPLMERLGPVPPPQLRSAANEGISFLRAYSGSEIESDSIGWALQRAEQYLKGGNGTVAAAVGTAIAKAIRCAIHPNDAAAYASEAITTAQYVLGHIREDLGGGDIRRAASRALEQDAELLFDLAHYERWTDSVRVPCETFGPLWPEGVPPAWTRLTGYRPEASENAELTFEIQIPDGVPDEQILQRVEELAAAADSVHRAYGGNGLTVETVEILQPTLAKVEVGR